MDITYKPYIDPDIESLLERIHPPRVCIDNDSFPDCTLVKVDSANKQGMLMEMVQVLTDLDLVISKSFISSDGGWLMDVFHVTDKQGKKITEQSLLHCIQEGICTCRMISKKVQPKSREEDRLGKACTGKMALEMTGIDRPGLMSELSAVLAELGCNISSAAAWTHNKRAVCIIYIEEDTNDGLPLSNPCRAAHVQAHLENVVEAHHYRDERRSLRLIPLETSHTHMERRLHQMMASDSDYEECCSCPGGGEDDAWERWWKGKHKRCNATHVRLDNCKKLGYSIVSVRSRDRPKLLFDTLCGLMDLQYVVSHASIRSKDSVAFQEYYLRHKRGNTLDSEDEKRKVTQQLVAATERRVSHGQRVDVSSKNRTGLLSDITRVFRENSLSITRAEIGTHGEEAVGTFYVKDTSEQSVKPETLEIVKKEIGDSIVMGSVSSEKESSKRWSGASEEGASWFSIGSLVRSQLDRLSNNLRLVRS